MSSFDGPVWGYDPGRTYTCCACHDAGHDGPCRCVEIAGYPLRSHAKMLIQQKDHEVKR